MKHYPVVDGPVFSQESPFVQLPLGLDATQRRYLEGIRFAIEMAQLSYLRLRDMLTSATADDRSQLTQRAVATAAFLDAWSLVDSLHRLRELLSAMPRFQKRDSLFQVFLRGTSGVAELRNRVQHLRGDLADASLAELPVWGTITWLMMKDDAAQRFLSGSLSAGPDTGGLRPLPVPNNRVFHDRLDHVTLHVGQADVDFSEAMRLTVRLAGGMEKSLRPQFEGKPPMPIVDALLVVEIQLEPQAEP